jgi:hypothetical protein
MLYHEPSTIKKMILMINVEKMNKLINIDLNTTILEYKKN